MGKGEGAHCYPCRISEVRTSAEKGRQMSKHFHTAPSVSDRTSSRMSAFTGLSKMAAAFSQLLGFLLFLYCTGVACDHFYKKVVM